MAFLARLLTRNLRNTIKEQCKPIKFCTTCEDEEDEKEKKPAPQPYRHNYHEEIEGAVNNQILAELNASMFYLSMCFYYGRTDVALPGCQAYFKMLALEEQTHAMEFANYQLMRGAIVKLFPLTVPQDADYQDITITLGVALEMEKRVKEKLETLFEVAESHEEMQLMDLIATKYVKEQNEAIWELGRLLTRARRLTGGGGVGKHLFDKEVCAYVAFKSPENAPQIYM